MIAQPVVYVVDDDPAIIRLLTELVKAIGLNVDAYQSAEEFLQAYQACGPGCLVLDVMVPGMSGIELQKRLTAAGSTLPIVFITGHADVRMAVEAMERGAFGFLEKPFRPQELCEKIQIAVRQDAEAWRRPGGTRNAAAPAGTAHACRAQGGRPPHGGKTNKMIAQELGLSARTVEAHRARLMQRLGMRSRTDLVRLVAAVAPLSGYADGARGAVGRGKNAGVPSMPLTLRERFPRARHGDRNPIIGLLGSTSLRVRSGRTTLSRQMGSPPREGISFPM